MKKISIKWRLFIYLAMFATATLILLWLFQVVFLASFYKAIKINEIYTTAENISRNIDNMDMQTLVTKVAQSKEVCIIVADEEGNILNSADVISDCVIHHMSLQEFLAFQDEAIANGGSKLNRFIMGGFKDDPNVFKGRAQRPASQTLESIIYTKIVINKDGTMLTLLLNANISPVDATVQTIRVQLIYVTIIMLLLALMLALFISRRVSKPIIKINATAKELAKGNYDIKFETKGYREIVELANTLNFAAVELAKTENLRRELIANISHDLRTPLTMIIGYAEVIRDLPGENTPENLQVIIDESRRLSSLVNDVLDISKLQSGTQAINISSYNLTESITNIIKRFSKLTEQEGYTITYIHDGDITVKADELKISQVIYNLLNNAITYTGADKSIIVRQSIANGKVRIEVIDTGEGIETEKLKDIWDRYYKVNKKHKRSQIGTGLGLSIVKAILEQHNEQYGVQSAVGEGCIFWFELKTL